MIKRIFKRAFKKPSFAISVVFLSMVLLAAIFAPWITPYSYEEQQIAERLLGPSTTHWMGTDSLGRDQLSRILFGARMSLAVGVFTAIFSLIFGTLSGAISGYLGGITDRVIMRIVDFLYIFPLLLLAILLSIVFGRGFFGIFLALAFASWGTQARLVRGLVLQAKEMPYVEAARALGVRSPRILFKHVLPNLWGPIAVSLTFQIPTNILTESFLSFVGLGLQPPYSSWGTLANEGFRALQSFPHLILFPGMALFFTLMAFSYLGEGIRDLTDTQGREPFDFNKSSG